MKMLSFDQYFQGKFIARITQRELDFSIADDSNPYNDQHCQFIAKNFDFSLRDIFSIKQVHKNDVVVIQKGKNPPLNYPQADGIITNRENFPVAIRTADCVPVFISDEERRCFGLIHAGWRGTRKNILEKALQVFTNQFNSQLSDLKIVLGPCIRSCCYAVGEEFFQSFPEDIVRRDNLFLNLPQANKRRLIRCGIKEENIMDCDICTCCNETCFSFRREGPRAGRMISLMMMKERSSCI